MAHVNAAELTFGLDVIEARLPLCETGYTVTTMSKTSVSGSLRIVYDVK